MRTTHNQRGASMMEILVTMLIVSFALLGIAGMQLTSIRYAQSSNFRETAANLAQGMAEKIRTNSAALSGTSDVTAYRAAEDYASATTIPTDPACGLGSGPCTAAQSAQRDLREWRLALQQELPAGRGALFPVTNGGLVSSSSRRVVVMWMEKPTNSDDNLGAMPTDPNCPTPRAPGVSCFVLTVQP